MRAPGSEPWSCPRRFIHTLMNKRKIHIKDLNNDNPNQLLEDYNKTGTGFCIGGFTTGAISDGLNNISVSLTDEELHKLFLHELIHFSNSDTLEYSENRNTVIKDKICEEQDITFEAFTEFVSNIYYLVSCVAKIKFKYNLDNNKCYSLLNELLQLETIWSLYVFTKILYLYGYNKANINDFFMRTEKCSIIKFDEIPLMSYYFGRSILLFNSYNILNDNYFKKDLRATKSYLNKEKELFTNINEEYISAIKEYLGYVNTQVTDSIGYICIELNDLTENEINNIIINNNKSLTEEEVFKLYINELKNMYENYNPQKGGKTSYKYKYLKYKLEYLKNR